MDIKSHELVELLMNLKGSKPVTIVTETKPQMRKTGNPFNEAVKVSRVNGIINWVYQNSVNAQRLRENQPIDNTGEVEHFTPKPRKWGVRLTKENGQVAPLVEHKGRHYLELKVERSLGHEYQMGDRTIDPKEIAPFLPVRKEGERQMVDSPVILRDYAIESIRQITMNGETYVVHH